MSILIKLYGNLREKVKIPNEEKKLIFMVNGSPRYDRNLMIKDKDTLAIFPPIGGG